MSNNSEKKKSNSLQRNQGEQDEAVTREEEKEWIVVPRCKLWGVQKKCKI